jgi:hypothetical protein
MFPRFVLPLFFAVSTALLLPLPGAGPGALAAQIVDRFELDALERLPLLKAEESPLFTVGSGDGPGAEIIGRLDEAFLTAEGGVIVLDRSAPRVRVFGPDGSLRHTLGGIGDGPGEFSGTARLAAAEVADGGFVIWDWGRGAAMRFGPEGGLEDHFTLREPIEFEEPLQRPTLLGVLDDGTLLMRSALRSPQLPGGVTGTRVAFDEFVVHRVDPATGGTTFWKRMLNEGSVHWRSVTTQERGVVISSGSWGSSALGQTFVAVDGSRLVWMTPERAVLEWWSPDAGVHRRSELGIPMRPMDEETREQLVDAISHVTPRNPPREPRLEFREPARELFQTISHRPVVSGLSRHSGGEFWIRTLHLEEGQRHPEGSLVLSPAGRPIAWYIPDLDERGVPIGRVLDARDGLVLLQLRDSLGVETLEVRRLSLQPFEPRT